VVDGTFLHLGLDAALSAPPGWTIENRPDRLIFEAPEDEGRVVATLDALDEAPESPASLLRARTPGVNLGEGRAFEARTGSGYTAVAVQRTPVGDRRVRHAIVVRAEQAWHFAGYSDSGTGFEAFSERFLAIASSLHALDDTERERARPLRLRVIEPTPGATWEELAAAVPARVTDPVARLRLLNGAYPDEPVPDGLVKTLE
jgi:predicted Zn-dependent protease